MSHAKNVLLTALNDLVPATSREQVAAIINQDITLTIDEARSFVQYRDGIANISFDSCTERLRHSGTDRIADVEAYEEFTAAELYHISDTEFSSLEILTFIDWLLYTGRKKMAVGVNIEPPASQPEKKEEEKEEDIVSATIAERGKVYGDPLDSHKNIGLSWTALLQQHYGLTFAKPIPASLVAQMMVCFKMQRSARVYKDDNYIDAHAYTKFAEEFQRKEEGK